MLEHTLDTENGILHLHPDSALQESDFAELASVLDPYIEGHGELKGVVVEAPSGFPGWDSLGAMAAHFRFVRDHHRRIRKIAIVTDARLGDVAEKLGSHFIAATIKHYPAGHAAEAERWILGA
ncbi:MAG TPA: STAS/SEC14 domain-containing protein [Candidatus Polarisedimenticolaceae bacterium]|nr:STAS/SEC14 domain-containing protein [Candidatus Polarisedimenticolaceae bacterium]